MGMDDIRLSVSSCLAYSDVNKTGSSGLLSNCLASSAWCRGNPGVKGELEKRGDYHSSSGLWLGVSLKVTNCLGVSPNFGSLVVSLTGTACA